MNDTIEVKAVSLDSVEKARKRAFEIIEKRKIALSEAKKNISSENAVIESLGKKAAEQRKAGDVAGFLKLREEIHEHQEIKLMNEETVTELENNPAIDADEYKALINSIKADLDRLTEETGRQVKNLAEAMNKAGEELRLTINDANTVIQSLQRDCYLDADRQPKNKDGIYSNQFDSKEYRFPNDLLYWAASAVKSFQYEKQCELLKESNK